MAPVQGWKLGESNMWCKETVLENDARVPLLIRAPWVHASIGRLVAEPVELISIYPTLAALGECNHPSRIRAAVSGHQNDWTSG
jgi:arylsulfatase A-like enzyme